MKVFLTGISCVGKTIIGAKLATLLGYSFFDLDEEIETFFEKPIERLQAEFLTMYSFREKASEALKHLLLQKNSKDCVITLPPSGLMDNYYRVIKKTEGMVIVLTDEPRNILARITFYDADSQPIEKQLSEDEKRYYLKEIKKDITYFGRTYGRADMIVNISGLGVDESTQKLQDALMGKVFC